MLIHFFIFAKILIHKLRKGVLMPTYLSITIQSKKENLYSTYVQDIYQTIIDYGDPFQSGYWFHKDATLPEIIRWN